MGAFRTADERDPQSMRWLVSERTSDERPESGSIEEGTAKEYQAEQGNPAVITRTATGVPLAARPPAQRRFVAPNCIVEGSALLRSRRASFPAGRPFERLLASSRQHIHPPHASGRSRPAFDLTTTGQTKSCAHKGNMLDARRPMRLQRPVAQLTNDVLSQGASSPVGHTRMRAPPAYLSVNVPRFPRWVPPGPASSSGVPHSPSDVVSRPLPMIVTHWLVTTRSNMQFALFVFQKSQFPVSSYFKTAVCNARSCCVVNDVMLSPRSLPVMTALTISTRFSTRF
ncbi:hypothetical protein PSPO01_02022 [Paraphaeosphaeria sporulosa]